MRILPIFIRPIFTTLLCAAAMAVPAHGNEQAKAALDAALADIATRKQNTEAVRFAFRTHIESSDADMGLIEYDFDPDKPIENRITIIHPTVEENPKTRKKFEKDLRKAVKRYHKKGIERKPDLDIVFPDIQKLTDGTIKFLRQTDTEWVFAFDVADDAVNFDSDNQSASEDKPNDKKKDNPLAEHLDGELAIDKEHQKVSWLRFYATESFKPASVVKVEQFDLVQNLAPAWPDGPLVAVKTEVKVKGSAVFKGFEQHVLTTHSGFERR